MNDREISGQASACSGRTGNLAVMKIKDVSSEQGGGPDAHDSTDRPWGVTGCRRAHLASYDGRDPASHHILGDP